jgi:hypothetical protein
MACRCAVTQTGVQLKAIRGGLDDEPGTSTPAIAMWPACFSPHEAAAALPEAAGQATWLLAAVDQHGAASLVETRDPSALASRVESASRGVEAVGSSSSSQGRIAADVAYRQTAQGSVSTALLRETLKSWPGDAAMRPGPGP